MQSPVAVAALKRLAHGRRAEDGEQLLHYGLLAALIALAALGVYWSAIANRF